MSFSTLPGMNCPFPTLIVLATMCIMCSLFSSCLGITLAIDKGFEGCEGSDETISIAEGRICGNTERIEDCKANPSCNWRASFLSIIMGEESADGTRVQCTVNAECDAGETCQNNFCATP